MMPTNILKILQSMIPNAGEANTPDEVAQLLLNSGRVTQEQVNRARQMWQQPQVREIIQKKYKY